MIYKLIEIMLLISLLNKYIIGNKTVGHELKGKMYIQIHSVDQANPDSQIDFAILIYL